MLHHNTERKGHYAVAREAHDAGVLIQIGNSYGDQARELLTPEEAIDLAMLLTNEAHGLKPAAK